MIEAILKYIEDINKMLKDLKIKESEEEKIYNTDIIYSIKVNYKYIPIINKKLLLQNQRRY